jgi:hypothetical protein
MQAANGALWVAARGHSMLMSNVLTKIRDGVKSPSKVRKTGENGQSFRRESYT